MHQETALNLEEGGGRKRAAGRDRTPAVVQVQELTRIAPSQWPPLPVKLKLCSEQLGKIFYPCIMLSAPSLRLGYCHIVWLFVAVFLHLLHFFAPISSPSYRGRPCGLSSSLSLHRSQSQLPPFRLPSFSLVFPFSSPFSFPL